MIALVLAGAITMHAAQADVYNLKQGAKVVVAAAGIRGGKTHELIFSAVLDAIQKPTREDQCHAIVSPSYRMSKIGPQPKLRAICGDATVFAVNPIVRWNKTEHTVWIKNCVGGLSKIRFFSGEEPDGWRGDEWLTGRLDEAAYLTDHAFEVAQGRVASTNGPIYMATSPNGFNFVYDQAERATEVLRAPEQVGYLVRRSPDGKVLFVQWGSLLNTLMPDSRGFAELAENYDPETYDQEVGGQFVGKTGRVYKAFTREKCVRELPTPAPTAPIYWGQDFNVDRMASVLLHEVAPSAPGKKGGLHAFAELEIRDANTHVLVDRIGQWCAEHRVERRRVIVVPDASGAKRQTGSTNAARSDIRILQQAGLRVEASRANPRVKDRVNCVNGLLYTGRLTVSPRCPLLIEALERQPWGDDGEPEKDGELDNRNDAAGYVCWKKFPLLRETSLGRAA